MAIAIFESDNGTKERTQEEMLQLSRAIPKSVEKELDAVFDKIYNAAIQFCPIDTGALVSTIQIVEGVLGEASGSIKDVMIFNKSIIAGDETITNPKTGRPVDYARFVHDGYTTRGGVWKAGVPFLTEAVEMYMVELEEAINKVIDYLEKRMVR